MMRRAPLILLLTILCAIGTVAAQDDPLVPVLPFTETPTVTNTPRVTPTATLAVTTEGIIFNSQAETIFPVGIRFTTIILRNFDEIEALSLTIERPGAPPQTIAIDRETALVDADAQNPEFAYLWEFSQDDFPPLFSEISYQWTVRSIYDEAGSAAETFQFTDSRLLWQQRTDANRRFDLAIPRGLNISQLGQTLDSVYDLLAANTGQQPALNILLYDTALDPQGCAPNDDGESVARGPATGTEAACANPSLADRIFAAGGYLVLQGRAYDFEDAANTVSDALFDRFHAPLQADTNVPAWFVSALRLLYRPTSNSDLLAPALSAARSNTLLTLDEMATTPPQGARADLWRAQSYGMLLYIADSVGLEGVWQLARDASSAGFSAAYERIMRQPLTSLVRNARDWLLTPRGEAAYGLAVYAEPTRTAAPSATFTPFPATRTPRPDASRTPTPTITPTPTERPTATLTPTVTPRPPGSLDTPTPIPAQTTAPLIEPTSRTSILAVLIIILAVLIIAFARVGRR